MTIMTLTCDGVGLGDEAGQTATDGVTINVGSAGGAGATGTGVARIWLLYTPLVPANIPILAIGINDTLRTTT